MVVVGSEVCFFERRLSTSGDDAFGGIILGTLGGMTSLDCMSMQCYVPRRNSYRRRLALRDRNG